MDFDSFRIKDVFELGHELETKMAVIKDDPEPVSKAIHNIGFRSNLLLFSHGHFHSIDLLFPRKLVDSVGRIGTSRKKVQDGLIW